jgi:hypothetical protein
MLIVLGLEEEVEVVVGRLGLETERLVSRARQGLRGEQTLEGMSALRLSNRQVVRKFLEKHMNRTIARLGKKLWASFFLSYLSGSLANESVVGLELWVGEGVSSPASSVNCHRLNNTV